MKKILIIGLLFLLFSCWNDSDTWVIEESGDIIEWYADTLETSIEDAREVRELMDDRYEDLWDYNN